MARAKICDLCGTFYMPYNENKVNYPNGIIMASTDNVGKTLP